MTKGITTRSFGTAPDGKDVLIFDLDAGSDCTVSVSEFGAGITSIRTPDRLGALGEICLGYDDLAGFENDSCHMGVTAGRYANRIADGKFSLNNNDYQLDVNTPPHHLHGGKTGFGRQYWQGESFETDSNVGVVFNRVSPDGENGYPGELSVSVTYSLTPDNVLTIDYLATTTADTYVNLTNHSYFNLSADDTILDHVITLPCDFYTPTDSTLIPTGEIAAVDGTAFDLRTPTALNHYLNDLPPELEVMAGYDVNYVAGKDTGQLRPMAHVADPKSGRTMLVKSTQPCIQFYTGNHVEGAPSRNGVPLKKFAALCLEAQTFPDGPNVPSFQVSPLRKGEEYRQHFEYHFAADA